MELRALGRTGVKVSPLCLGAMMFGAWGNTDHDESIRIIHRALDAGGRDHVVLATKVHGRMGDDPNEYGNTRRWIRHEVESSLRRLGTDWIDLYQIHRPE